MSRYTAGEEIVIDMGDDLRSIIGYYVDEYENEIHYHDGNGKNYVVANWKAIPVRELQENKSSEEGKTK